ncbi:MAG: hypothetical protein R3E87_13075 [Burkholderiaceae bacterium]
MAEPGAPGRSDDTSEPGPGMGVWSNAPGEATTGRRQEPRAPSRPFPDAAHEAEYTAGGRPLETGDAPHPDAEPRPRRAIPPAARQLVTPVFVRLANHLLGQHPNANRRLAAHVGRHVRVGLQDRASRPIDAFSVTVRIVDGGRIGSGSEAANTPADAELYLQAGPSTFSALAGGQPRAALDALRLEGDPMLAGLVAEILADLRWDVEDDLAAVIGDVPARRLSSWFGQARAALADTGQRTGTQLERVGARLVETGAMTAPRAGFETLSDTVRELLDRLDDLQHRLDGFPPAKSR